jgi:hypothetical protein
MVCPAPVTHPRKGGSNRTLGTESGGGDGPCGRGTTGFGGTGFGRVGVRRCRVIARAALPARRVRLPRSSCQAVFVTGVSKWPGSQGFDFVGTMFIVRPTLTNSAPIPIFQCGMTSNRSVRPDYTPILERTGHPLPTRLFRRPPARVPLGSAPRRRAAYRSSGLDDQAHVDRCHTRGRNPRRGAGW